EASHEHPHPAEHRHDEHDDDDEDLDGHADGGVPGVPHEMPHQGVIDHPLEPADEILQHRGPSEHPDGASERTLDDGAIEGLTSPAWHPGSTAPRPRPRCRAK